jgi:RNA-splicing ligase RtcB
LHFGSRGFGHGIATWFLALGPEGIFGRNKGRKSIWPDTALKRTAKGKLEKITGFVRKGSTPTFPGPHGFAGGKNTPRAAAVRVSI